MEYDIPQLLIFRIFFLYRASLFQQVFVLAYSNYESNW